MTSRLVERLIVAGVKPTPAKLFAEPLAAAMALNAIDTDARQAAFIAQAMVESTNFTELEENLRYTSERAVLGAFGKRAIPHMQRILRNPVAMANFAYAGRNGNGDEASGDGWLFRGRGIFQLTGRENYRKASEGMGLGAVFVNAPDLVSQPSDACQTAAWYWRTNGCNQAIDAGMFDATTRAINGRAMLHAQKRSQTFAVTLAVFNGNLA